MDKLINCNQVDLMGFISKSAEFSHESYGEKFYRIVVNVPRTSGYEDKIPVLVSDHLCKPNTLLEGKHISISGQFRSSNNSDGQKQHLILFVFALDIDFVSENVCHTNSIELEGFICKKPHYRLTPFEREITDVLLAVNRSYGKSSFIPCICWGRNALFASDLDVGAHIKLSGRIQSREYTKKISETESETRVAYEVSVSKIELVEEE